MAVNLFETIEKHRWLWNGIARETERRKKPIGKRRFLESAGIEANMRPFRNTCYLCDYSGEFLFDCDLCPVIWQTVDGTKTDTCCDEDSVYDAWEDTGSWREVAELARVIANLPLKAEYKEQYEQEKLESREKRKEAKKLRKQHGKERKRGIT